ncbi:hypothetical protein DXG03_003851 [Asterophora parasitica]|uniref:Peptidase S9 prolyl oligopeptidase catalytic domain-containing protein n=1 Tax=Asterophora parasitica TaxID=117018 RepID=A0A9P7G378_9AGAR|nr:hypothetical protein DXG03_003851 [Asterophora parasitica]
MNTPQLNPGGYINASISNVTGFHSVDYLLAHGSGDDNVHYANSAHLLDMFTKEQVRGFRFRMFTDRMQLQHILSPSHPDENKKRDRPRGLWKARVTGPRSRKARSTAAESDSSHSTDVDIDDDDDADSVVSKRHRHEDYSDSEDEAQFYYWDYSRKCSPYPDRVSSWETSKRIMTTSTIAEEAPVSSKETCDYEDWEDLKELFARAAHMYENGSTSEAFPILRGVIHECHRFLIYFEDPSVLFVNQGSHPESSTQPATKERRWYDLSLIFMPPILNFLSYSKCVELPTAFHVILGTVLFMFGNLIAQEPSHALEGEPDSPVPYWLAALDVFETGESLPSRTNGLSGCDAPEDWRMALVWGRTLVCIADEAVSRARHGDGAMDENVTAQFLGNDPEWPPESPFSAIAARRPPITRRMSLFSATPNDLLVLAMDQFSRGIFHMPHPQHQPLPPIPTPSTITSPTSPTELPPTPAVPPEPFSRAKELYTLASEVLLLAEKLPIPQERQTWAAWADSVFRQMKMEADVDAWRRPIQRARGRCWLVQGSAKIDELEGLMEKGELDLGSSEDAQKAREGLGRAIEFFERAKRGEEEVVVDGDEEEEERELRTLLAEALLTLGNLTAEEGKREDLYRRAQIEGGEDYLMGSDDDDDEAMDDS